MSTTELNIRDPPANNLEYVHTFLVNLFEKQILFKIYRLVIDAPRNKLYMDYHIPLCKLLKHPSLICCLELNNECEHTSCKHASDYMWKNNCVIIATDYATNGLYSFLLPLRAHVRSAGFLKPIIFLLKNR